jgi:cytochrome c peroxidase
MIMKKLLTLLIPIITALTACSDGSMSPEAKQAAEEERASERYDKLLSDKLNAFQPLPFKAENPDNPESAAKIKLGHVLYYDTRLSKDGNNSCNSCHNLATYGVDNLPTSPGDLGENGDRNSPTTLNAALHFKQFWDGRAADVEEQAGGPVLNPIEMNIPSKAFMEQRLKDVPMYQRLFAEAFPESGNPITYDNMQRAIGVFERQFLTPSRFDDYLRGKKEALTLNEKKGLLSFVLVG